MKKILTVVLLSGIIFSGHNASAESLSDELNTEATISHSLDDSPTLNKDTRISSGIQVSMWVNVGAKAQNGKWVPISTKMWQVKYYNGRRYEGYLYWTGGVHVNVSDPRPNLNKYQFSGFLNLK